MADWKRPDIGALYPKVYAEFEGKLVVNGSKRKYWIQDLTEEYFDEVVNTYAKYFLDDEPLNKCLGSAHDPECFQEFTTYWQKLLEQKISLICLTKDDEGTVKIAGFNVLYAACKTDKENPLPAINEKTKKLIAVMGYFTDQRDAFAEFQIDEYISAMGLYVVQAYRGEGLGQVILDTRKCIAKDMGFKVSLTVFTSVISQKQAERVGFQDYVTTSYADLEKERPELKVPGIHEISKLCKLMYRKI